jgi:methyl-accepting chemotaxis protein
MIFLDNLKISNKILMAMLTLAVALGVSATYSSLQLHRIASTYSVLTEQKGPAAVEVARAARQVNQLGYAAYRVATYDAADPEAQASKAAFEDSVGKLRANLDNAARLAPDPGVCIADCRATADQIGGLARPAIDAGMQNQDAEAKAAMAKADPRIAALTEELRTFNEAGTAANKAASDALQASADQTTLLNIALGVVGVVGGLGLGLWLSATKISRPLNQLAERMGRLAAGDLTVAVEGQARGDEVGGMAQAVQVFKDNALQARAAEAEADRLRAEAEETRRANEAARAKAAKEQAEAMEQIGVGLARLSRGDLTYRLDAEFAEDYRRLQEDFNKAVETLQATMKEISNNTLGIKAGTGDITSASDDLSRRTEQQAASLEETAAALEQITATVRKTAEGANHAHQVVAAARQDAETGGEVVGRAIAAMSAIEHSSTQISQIIGVIDEIAFQTNLLALHAGVDAARAGDAGKGFAVVAQEVRALAQRSAEAAKEIKALIHASTTQVGTGVDLVGQTGEALARIVTQVAQINTVVSEIAASAQEQSSGLQQVNIAVNQMDQVTQQNAAMVEESTAASHALAQEADDLSRLMEQFQVGGAQVATSQARAGAPSHPVHAAQTRVARMAASGSAARKLDTWEEF